MAEGLEVFRDEVRPLFLDSCLGCHGSGQVLGGLDLRSPRVPGSERQARRFGQIERDLGGEAFDQWLRDGAPGSSADEWQVLDIVDIKSVSEAKADKLEDGSILISGDNVNFDTYTVSAEHLREGPSSPQGRGPDAPVIAVQRPWPLARRQVSPRPRFCGGPAEVRTPRRARRDRVGECAGNRPTGSGLRLRLLGHRRRQQPKRVGTSSRRNRLGPCDRL